MSIDIWIPSSGMAPIQFFGKVEFRDTVIPMPGKDEWGVNTLERTMRGPASKVGAFYNSLQQGDTFKDRNGNTFFLQSWQPIEHHCFPGAQISYKGFIGGALPDPLPITVYNETTSMLTADGLHVTISGGEDDTERVITGGTREIKYVAPTTTWRYINRGEPAGPRFNSVRGFGVVNRASQIFATFEDGSSERYVSTAPAGLAVALFAPLYVDTIGPSFIPILGTPYYECEEVCQLRYPDT